MPVSTIEDILLTHRWTIWRQMAAYGVIDGIIYVIYLDITIKMCTFAA